MTRPRVPLGLEASRTTLDLAFAGELGQRARAARVALGLDTQAAARALGFSTAQLISLETAQPEVFYGAEFYANALRKYLGYLGLDTAAVSQVLVQPTAPAGKASTSRRANPTRDGAADATPASTRPARVARTSRPPALAPTVIAAAVAASAFGAWQLLPARKPEAARAPASGLAGADNGNTNQPALGPASPENPPAESPAPDLPAVDSSNEDLSNLGSVSGAAVSAVNVASEALPHVLQGSALPPGSGGAPSASRYGSVTVSRATWIFVRYADNTTDERSLGPGESVVLRAQPVYLAVGGAEGTTVVLGGQRIDLDAFVVNGQVRIGRAFLGTFMAGL